VTFALRHLVFTFTADNRLMTKHDDTETVTAGSAASPDPQRVLESVVSELEYLIHDAPLGSGADLLQLHGALLVYNLEGRAELVPPPSFGLSARSWRERRVVRSAQRIIERGAGNTTAAMAIAADLIEQHLHLIDPELLARAA